MSQVLFFYEFASTYSYLSVMRAERLARTAGIELAWRPFLLGPIFKAQGWATSPFNLYPAKGRYMVRDISRIATARGLPFVMPATFPANGLLAARIATALEDSGHTPAFSKAVFEAQFAKGKDISDSRVLEELLTNLRLDAKAVLARAASQATKVALKERTDEAEARGVFGAPTFVTADGEVFWGDDRLEQALTWTPPD